MSKNTVAIAYETALCRVVLEAADCCREVTVHGTPLRSLVNYLRGNQPPPDAGADGSNRRDHTCHGLLHEHAASWLADALAALSEEGYLALDENRARRISVTPAGRRLLTNRERLSGSILPRPAKLGAHPGVENKLAELRRRLAREEGRPPFSIFDNRALAWLAEHRPRSMADLAAAPGFGEKRLGRYGQPVLRVLRTV